LNGGTLKTKFYSVVLIFLFSLWFINPLLSQETERKIYTTKPVNPNPPTIDGKMDDQCWHEVDWGKNFIQRMPHEGEDPSQKTAFKILYDRNNLYIAIRAYDSEPEKIAKHMCRRDIFKGDWVEVNIDSHHDLRTAFSFTVNAAGVKGDQTITNNGDNWDSSWDPIWFVKTSIDSEGWIAEMRIPLSQLRFREKKNHIWGLQVQRNIFRSEERSSWQFISRNSPGWVHLFGELRGIQDVKSKRMIQILPYTVGELHSFKQEKENPFSTGQLSNLYGGFDGKIGITKDLILDVTLNPDFGEVEADPSVVNLTVFETYFPEKRPFFVEGKNIFNYQFTFGDNPLHKDNLFYSRRIGGNPHHNPELKNNEYANVPENTSIVGALKITGKTSGGLSIGIMDSITSIENAEIDYLGQQRKEVVEPLTNYFILRLQQDINKGKTIIGGMFTATNRKINVKHLSYLHNGAYTGGFDFLHTWKRKSYYFSITSIFSFIKGSNEALLETQRSSVHYFQRPDASYLSVDPQLNSLFGHGGQIAFGKQGGMPIVFHIGATWRSPGLELNDVGYLRRADIFMQWIWAQYRITNPFSIFNAVYLSVNQMSGWNFGYENIFNEGNINLYTQFKNNWRFGIGIDRESDWLSTSILRGGPALLLPGGWRNWFNIQSNKGHRIRFNFGWRNYQGNHKAQRSKELWGSATFQSTDALSISFSPSLNTNENMLQYVTEKKYGFESRYLFAKINQKTISLTTRLSLNITPDFTVQFYGQPFISTGSYTEFKRVTNFRALEFSDRFISFLNNQISYNPNDEYYRIDENMDGTWDYKFNNPNFNFLQFRSNLIIRWEYIPGSTLYLVWSQGRTQTHKNGGFYLRNNLKELFNIFPYNVFLVKISYSFNN